NPTEGDFHLKSSGGRYDRQTGTFVNDSVTSPLIDAAYYLADFSAESMPNGSRANIGAFGGTPWASRSPATPMLQVVSLNDGGWAAGTVQPLYWVATGSATGHTVSIEL